MSDEILLFLSEAIEAQMYGGKAARLSESLRAGLPVPPGFVLHPDFVARVAQGNLAPQERVLLECSLASFTERAVAVRSSAIGEDGTVASFAGQYTSILNVQGMDNILAAIATVWASGQTEAALQYRARMRITGIARVAVIIQALVQAEVAGVLFTVDPLSGSRERWIVEASWGLGEAVVSGLVTPDRYIISRTGQLRESHLGDKDIAIIAAEDGGVTRVEIHNLESHLANGLRPSSLRQDAGKYLESHLVNGLRPSSLRQDARKYLESHLVNGLRPSSLRQDARKYSEWARSACLDESALVHLADLGAACERLFGPALDIEWALLDGILSLLQCRPVTSGGRA